MRPEPQLAYIRAEFGISSSPRPLSLDEYQQCASKTNKRGIAFDGCREFFLLGLFGEIGSLLSELKKKHRDATAYFAYADSALEELGDVLWYFSNFAMASHLTLSEIANNAVSDMYEPLAGSVKELAELQPQARLFHAPMSGPKVEARLLELAVEAGGLLEAARSTVAGSVTLRQSIQRVFSAILGAADDAQISLEVAATRNLRKALDRWPPTKWWGELYDDKYEANEQFPRHFEIVFTEEVVGGRKYVFQRCNGINLGDRLTDNRREEDDYRFHDVFHISYAAILGWSPVLRALFKLKRKSDPEVDEQQDGARAIITEEGIANWIFAQGVRHSRFEDVSALEFALLKTIRGMVKDYEVETRPFWMWEHAILEGFRVFRALTAHRGGTVVGDLSARKLIFRPPND